MCLVTKYGYLVRDLLDDRIARVRAGEVLDPFLEVGRLRVVAASLVKVALLVDADWLLPGVALSAKGAAIDDLRRRIDHEIRTRVMAVEGKFEEVDQRILLAFADSIGELVVELAVVTFAYETMHWALVRPSRRKARSTLRVKTDPADLALKSALHMDPEAVLQDAQERLRVAQEDIDRARRRMSYVGGDKRPVQRTAWWLAPCRLRPVWCLRPLPRSGAPRMICFGR